jgi:hypothetical protein
MISADEKRIAETLLSSGVRVSTVFLGLVQVPGQPDPEMQWETLVLGGPYHDQGEQYASVEDARAGHELWVLVAQGVLTPEAIYEMREVTQ